MEPRGWIYPVRPGSRRRSTKLYIRPTLLWLSFGLSFGSSHWVSWQFCLALWVPGWLCFENWTRFFAGALGTLKCQGFSRAPHSAFLLHVCPHMPHLCRSQRTVPFPLLYVWVARLEWPVPYLITALFLQVLGLKAYTTTARVLVIILFLFAFVFWFRVPLHNLDCPGTWNVDQAVIRLRSACLCSTGEGITGVCHHTVCPLFFFGDKVSCSMGLTYRTLALSAKCLTILTDLKWRV